MSKRVTWRKGMRLTSEIFNVMEACHLDSVRAAGAIASAGRLGLFGEADEFALSVNVENNIVETVELRCKGITRSGKTVDARITPDYTRCVDTRASIPSGQDEESFLLTLRLLDNEWREVDDVCSEESFRFEIVRQDAQLHPDSLPLGLLVNRFGWRLDETEFVPPCLFVHSHTGYMAKAARVRQLAEALSEKCLASPGCQARVLTGRLWSAASKVRNVVDCEIQTLTPERLLALVRELVGEFFIGVTLDERVSLEDYGPYVDYVRGVYDAGNLCRDIERGLSLLTEIQSKMDVVCSLTEEAPHVPERPARRPQPKPAPEPAAARRKGWEGLEI